MGALLVAILENLAETVSGMFAEKAATRIAKKFRWFAPLVLVAIIVFLIGFGVYLCLYEALWIGILMFVIAAAIAGIFVWSVIASRRKKAGDSR